MRRTFLALIFVALPLATVLVTAQTRSPVPSAVEGRASTDVAGSASTAASIELSSLDRTADACVDFYQFACGGWVTAHPLPADRQRLGRFVELLDRNYTILRRILDPSTPPDASPSTSLGTSTSASLRARTSTSPDLQKARDYYAACMDEPAVNRAGRGPLASELARIDRIRNRTDLPETIAHLQQIAGEVAASGGTRRAGMYVFFRFSSQPKFDEATTEQANVTPDGIGLPGRDYYLKTDTRSIALRDAYQAHVTKMLTLAGMSSRDARRQAQAVVSLETSLAAAMLDIAARRDPNARNHPMSIEELQGLTPSLNWKRYLTAIGAPGFSTLNVSEPEFMRAVDRVLAQTPLDDLKAYMKWHLVHAAATRLPDAFADATFDFFNRTLTGQNETQPRWRECVADTDQQLGEALGKAFVEEAFSPDAKADMLRMVGGIRAAMKRDIEEASWMAPETKSAALVKLDAVLDRVGYPETWRDYSALRVSRTDALGNLQRALAFHNARRVAEIGRPTDRAQWSMTPPTVNAYYNPSSNNINFPAGILQPPFYRAGGDAAANYGAIGGVIAHELTHGFDDQGRKYDAKGNLRDWWTPADSKAYDSRSSCIADQYSQYTVAGDTQINGKLTLGENTADNGGLRLALMAYLAGPGAAAQSPVDGFTGEQRVFLGWAQQWCEVATPQAERLKAATNPHSSNPYRVNGVVSNMPEFQNAFSCKAGAPMVRANACRVW